MNKNAEKRGHVLPTYSQATLFETSKYFLRKKQASQTKIYYPLRDWVM